MESADRHNLYAEIQGVARKVHARCNGARSADGKGFGRRDVSIGPAIAIAELRYWSDGLAARGVNLLLRYHRQIPEDMDRLRQLEQVFPDTMAPIKVPPVVGIHDGRIALLSGPIGAEKEELTRLKKVLKHLGFGDCDKELIRVLDDEPCDPVNYDEPLVALETAGWCILPEAKGAFGSYLARLKETATSARWRIQQEAERRVHVTATQVIVIPQATMATSRQLQKTSRPGHIREEVWMPGDETIPALWFDISDANDLPILQELFQNRMRKDPSGTRWWILPRPTAADKNAAKAFVRERDWRTNLF